MVTDVKQPPYDLDAEEAVLGSVLIDPEALYRLGDLSPDDFYREKNRWTFQAMKQLESRTEATNQITVASELARERKLEACGGAAYLSHLVSQVPTSVHAEHYGKIVQRLSLMRRLISAANQVAAIGYEAPPDVDEALARAEAYIANLHSSGEKDTSTLYQKDAWEFVNRAVCEAGKHKRLVTMGWPKFDDLVRFRNATTSVIAGYTSFGKTILGEHIAERAAKLGFNAAYFHYELGNKEMMFRRICRYMEVAGPNGQPMPPRMNDLEDGLLWDRPALLEINKVWDAWKAKVTLVESFGWSLPKLCSRIKQLSTKGLTDVVIVDYLQKMPRMDVGKSRLTDAQAVGEIMKQLEITCQSLPTKPPLIILSQLNREGEIRDSGEIEEHAKVVIYIENQWKMTKGKCLSTCPYGRIAFCDDGCIELVIDKNSFGRCDRVKLRHDRRRFRFYEPFGGGV